jgi:hypothetical protein
MELMLWSAKPLLKEEKNDLVMRSSSWAERWAAEVARLRSA